MLVKYQSHLCCEVNPDFLPDVDSLGKRMKWKKKNEKITPLGSLKVCANIYEIWMLVTQGGRKLWNFGWELGAIELESTPRMIKKKDV